MSGQRIDLPPCFQPKLYVCPNQDCGYIGSAGPQWRFPGSDKAPCFGCGRELDDSDLHVFGPEGGTEDDGPTPSYHGVRREWPPTPNDIVVRWSSWWGCPQWLVRAEWVLEDRHLQPEEAIGAIVNEAQTRIADAVDAQLRLARFYKSTILGEDGEETDLANIPIGANPRFALNPDFLAYCSAIVEVDRWLWLSPFAARDTKGSVDDGAGIVLGTRADELVALIPPVDLEADS